MSNKKQELTTFNNIKVKMKFSLKILKTELIMKTWN